MSFSASVLGSSNADFLTFQTPSLGGSSLLMEGFQAADSLLIGADLDGASITGGQGGDWIGFFSGDPTEDQFSVFNSTIKGGADADTIYSYQEAPLTDWLDNFLNANDGDDYVYIYTETTSNSTFSGGQGNDYIYLKTILAQNGNLVNGNMGADTIELDSDGTDPGIFDATALGGQGNDIILADDETIATSHFNGDLGNDFLNFRKNKIADTTIRGGGGTDSIRVQEGSLDNSLISGNSGSDLVAIMGGMKLSSTVQGGQGNDQINVSGMFSDGLINGNLGNDLLEVKGNFGGTSIFGGQGQDTIELDVGMMHGGGLVLYDSLDETSVQLDESGQKSATVAGNIGADLLIDISSRPDISFFYNYGDTTINSSGAGRDTIRGFSEGDSISVADGIDFIGEVDASSLNNFISASASSANSGFAFQWYDDVVQSTYVFVSDGSGSLNADDILVQVEASGGLDTPFTFKLDGDALVLNSILT